MREQEIRVDTGDGPMTTFVVHPDGDGPFPVGLLFMDGVGYREQVKENARRFAAGGYYVVVADLFHRSGEKVSFDVVRLRQDDDYRAELMAVVAKVTPDAAMTDARAALAAIAGDPAAVADGPKVCVGYCMGARVALYAAARLADEVVAAACIHPSKLVTDADDSPHLELPNVRGELYFALAENDHTAEDVEAFRQELSQAGVSADVEHVPATHGFAMADLPMYDRDASERHFERTLELWRRSLSRERVSA
jgi:carboxymethylenebutenolidase